MTPRKPSRPRERQEQKSVYLFDAHHPVKFDLSGYHYIKKLMMSEPDGYYHGKRYDQPQ
jgi:hypothetical protein